MRLSDSDGLHESCNIVREIFDAVIAFGLTTLSRSTKVERKAGKLFRVFRHLEGITGRIGCQVRNQDKGLTRPLLVIVDRYVVGLCFRHGVSPSGDFWTC